MSGLASADGPLLWMMLAGLVLVVLAWAEGSIRGVRAGRRRPEGRVRHGAAPLPGQNPYN